MIKVAIIDDHPMVLSGLQNILSDSPMIHLTGSYLNGESLLKALKNDNIPDVLLLDMLLPDIPGEEIAAYLQKNFPEIRIIVLTSVDSIYRVEKILQAGCRGYLLKNVSKTSLIQAILTVYNGEKCIEPMIQDELIKVHQEISPSKDLFLPAVTRREKEILQLLKQGHTSQEMANILVLSIRTVENHRKSLLHKFNAKNTVGLLNVAGKMGVLD